MEGGTSSLKGVKRKCASKMTKVMKLVVRVGSAAIDVDGVGQLSGINAGPH